MSNFKRKKSRRQIRCSLCTKHRWKGNSRQDIHRRRMRAEAAAKDQ